MSGLLQVQSKFLKRFTDCRLLWRFVRTIQPATGKSDISGPWVTVMFGPNDKQHLGGCRPFLKNHSDGGVASLARLQDLWCVASKMGGNRCEIQALKGCHVGRCNSNVSSI